MNRCREHLALLRSFRVNVRVFQLSKSGILFRLLRNVFGSIPFQTAYHTDKGAIKALREGIRGKVSLMYFFVNCCAPVSW